MIELKKQLYRQCLDYIQNRIEAAKFAIDEAQSAANDETKSSAGDKYETGREMMQQEAERNVLQLTEANKLKVSLTRVSITTVSDKAESGSLVLTDNGNFFIAISAGALMINNETYFAISQESPIGAKLKGLKKNDEFLLNGKQYVVKLVT